MTNLKQLGCLIIVLISLVLFQNCGQTGQGLATGNSAHSLLSSSETVTQGDGGNGTQYDGKIKPGKYIRQLTENFCGNQIKNLGEIVVTETTATGRLIDPQTCTTQDVQLDLNILDHATYQEGRIGFLEGIYSSQGKKGEIQKVNGIDEVWCRKEGSTTATGFDIVIKAEYEKRTYTALVASSDGVQEVAYEPFRIEERRFEDNDRVRYDAKGFDLDIRRRDFNSATGTMSGDLEYTRNGLREFMRINCRLGGELDVMIPKK